MNKLKQNAFWAGIGAAGIVLILFYAYIGVQVVAKKGGKQARVTNLVRTLRNYNTVPGNEDIRSYDDARAKYLDNYQKIGDFYAKSKEHLDRWFPKLGLQNNQDPSRDGFMNEYNTNRLEIENALKGKNVAIGVPDPNNADKHKLGFNWEEPTADELNRLMQSGDEKKVIREIQKRFWARKRVADGILAILAQPGGKVTRVHDFRFFKKLHNTLGGAQWEVWPQGTDAVTYMGVGAAQPNAAPQNFTEYELPQKLGRTMTFGFAVELPYSQVPRMLSEMLNPENANARLLVNVIGSHITIREQNLPSEKVTYTQGDTAGKERAIKEKQDGVKPVEVLLTVTCQMIDFEPAELKKFDGTAAAPVSN